MKRVLIGIASLTIAAAIWLPCLHLFYTPSETECFPEAGFPAEAEELAAQALHLWSDPASLRVETIRQRGSNPEWDFMARTFTVLAFANICAAEPARKAVLGPVIDSIISDTLRKESENSQYYFLMDYARSTPYVVQPASSLFVDGEIALMMAARRLAGIEPQLWEKLTVERVSAIARRFENAEYPLLESYPDECWLFDHAMALAAIRISDHLDGTDHSELFERWLAFAKEELVDEKTGLLVSMTTVDGRALDGPEGSTIWAAAAMLSLVYPEFAADQFRRASKELGRTIFGFGYAREWPSSRVGPQDIDSGAMILGASPSSSGLMLMAARTFGDTDAFRALVASLHYAAYPVVEDGRRRYIASNQVGDAAMLYGWVTGPLWRELEKK